MATLKQNQSLWLKRLLVCFKSQIRDRQRIALGHKHQQRSRAYTINNRSRLILIKHLNALERYLVAPSRSDGSSAVDEEVVGILSWESTITCWIFVNDFEHHRGLARIAISPVNLKRINDCRQ
ncbi:hypothetical protein D3C81_1241140 [compost metagenome]